MIMWDINKPSPSINTKLHTAVKQNVLYPKYYYKIEMKDIFKLCGDWETFDV